MYCAHICTYNTFTCKNVSRRPQEEEKKNYKGSENGECNEGLYEKYSEQQERARKEAREMEARKIELEERLAQWEKERDTLFNVDMLDVKGQCQKYASESGIQCLFRVSRKQWAIFSPWIMAFEQPPSFENTALATDTETERLL